MPRKKTKKLNKESEATQLKIDDNEVNNESKKDVSYNPLDALSDKFISLNELQQKNKGVLPQKGILELELESLVFEDLYKSEGEVSQNVRQMFFN